MHFSEYKVLQQSVKYTWSELPQVCCNPPNANGPPAEKPYNEH